MLWEVNFIPLKLWKVGKIKLNCQDSVCRAHNWVKLTQIGCSKTWSYWNCIGFSSFYTSFICYLCPGHSDELVSVILFSFSNWHFFTPPWPGYSWRQTCLMRPAETGTRLTRPKPTVHKDTIKLKPQNVMTWRNFINWVCKKFKIETLLSCVHV